VSGTHEQLLAAQRVSRAELARLLV
jgi:hypothetical protein